MYYIYTDEKRIEIKDSYPSELIQELSNGPTSVVVVSTYSNTVKIPMFTTLNGEIDSYCLETKVAQYELDEFIRTAKVLPLAIALFQRNAKC